MLTDLAVKDSPDAYQGMLSDWKLELTSTPDDFPHIRITPLVYLRAPADDAILPQHEPHMMPTVTDDICPISQSLTQEVTPTFGLLTPIETILLLAVDLPGRPHVLPQLMLNPQVSSTNTSDHLPLIFKPTDSNFTRMWTHPSLFTLTCAATTDTRYSLAPTRTQLS
jgi:hypothetical protein